jgi:hypothetical protein
MKKSFNKTVFAGLVVLAVLLFAACRGGYTDPSSIGGSNSGGYDYDDYDDGGSSGGGKPSQLSSNASESQARAKLDEIIAYSGTPAEVKEEAQLIKNAWSAYSSNWSVTKSSIIPVINILIDYI